MKQQSDGTYVIDLQLHLPAYFKFTQGDWDHQLYMENAMPGNLVIYNPQPATRIYYPYEDQYIGENLYNSQIPDLQNASRGFLYIYGMAIMP